MAPPLVKATGRDSGGFRLRPNKPPAHYEVSNAALRHVHVFLPFLRLQFLGRSGLKNRLKIRHPGLYLSWLVLKVNSRVPLSHESTHHFLSDELLFRKWACVVMGVQADSVVQVVVPLRFRDLVSSTSHDGVAGHLGVKKTYDKVLRHFFWQSLKKDVAEYCKICKKCQMTGKPNQKLKPNPCTPFLLWSSQLNICCLTMWADFQGVRLVISIY